MLIMLRGTDALSENPQDKIFRFANQEIHVHRYIDRQKQPTPSPKKHTKPVGLSERRPSEGAAINVPPDANALSSDPHVVARPNG